MEDDSSIKRIMTTARRRKCLYSSAEGGSGTQQDANETEIGNPRQMGIEKKARH